MTREEQLDWLYRLRSEIYVYMPKEWLIPMNNALDMAIKALERQSEDAVSRKAVVEYIKASDADLGHDSENEFAVEDILNMSPVTPTQKWIPVSERLPELDDDGYSTYVLVSFSNFTLPCIGQLRKTDGENHWYEGDDEKALDSFGLHVNAWMPLPKPYKAKSEG